MGNSSNSRSSTASIEQRIEDETGVSLKEIRGGVRRRDVISARHRLVMALFHDGLRMKEIAARAGMTVEGAASIIRRWA